MKDPLFEPPRDIIVAQPKDLHFVLDLQKRHSNALGFLPRAALDWYLDNARVTLALDNGQPAGYVLGRDALRWNIAIRPITQAAIHYDAQRRHHGLALVAQTTDDARGAGQICAQAFCREGLDANEFWRAAGFEDIGRYHPSNARKKQMICWRKQLTDFRPSWFELMPPYAGWKAKRTTKGAQR